MKKINTDEEELTAEETPEETSAEESSEESSEEDSEKKADTSKDSKEEKPAKDKLASNRRALIIEIALAAVAIIVIIIAIAIRQKGNPASGSDTVSGQTAAAAGDAGSDVISIDNSALYDPVPAIPAMTQNETLDYEALVSEGKMLKLNDEEGNTVYVHNYTDKDYFVSETPLDEDALDAQITKEVLGNYITPVEVSRDTAQMYDTVSINFAGKKDGVAFDGGSADDQTVTIGISAYIDGFTEGIVGMKVGEVKDINVTFPKDYSNADLAGQPAVFTITLNEIICGNEVPELTDAIVSEYTGGELATAAELRDYYRKVKLSEVIWDFIDSDFYLSAISKERVQKYYDNIIKQLDENSQSYQMSAESLISMYYGVDLEAYKAEMMTSAVESVRHITLYKAIAAKEGISVSEDDVKKLAADYGYADDVEAFKAQYGEDTINDYILQSNIMDRFMSLRDK